MIAALLAEGTSDKALLPILRWMLGCLSPADARVEWVDTASFETRPRTLAQKVELSRIIFIDAGAIRAASGRISGTEDLGLPPLVKIEADAKPKDTLRRALTRAQGATGRRADQFHAPTAVHRLANLIEDWSPLRRLTAFQRLEADTRAALTALKIELHPSSS